MSDLLARDAPWAGAPSAVAVAKRPAFEIPAQRSGPPAASRTGSRPVAGAGVRPGSRAGVRPGSRAGATAPGGRLRQLASAAWGPQWRFVTIAAAVLLTGLMANGVMLAAFSGPSRGAAEASAGSDEGGYPGTEDPNAASRSYDDNGLPIDSVLSPMFSMPTAARTQPGVGLPLTLTSLGTAVPAASPAATTGMRGTSVASTPVRAVSPSPTRTVVGSTGTGASTTGRSSGSGSTVGDIVRDTTSGVGKTVDKTASGLGKTLKKTTTGLGDTVGGVADDLLGGGSSKSSKSSKSSGGSKSGSGSKSDGGLLGGLLGN